ncbi:MAG: DUF488 domain-containing protein [Saprospiraceae bacterium]|nr:DUF488 domain-containing protein [Saprospiraceae bacterium]
MIKLYTIGFTGKNASQFFGLLRNNEVSTVIDVRISNASQLAGFTKASDFPFFLGEIGGIGYEHNLDFAPTRELLDLYRHKKMTWKEYGDAYLNLIDMRKIGNKIHPENLHQHCLLCSEHGPEKCHRRLLAEYFQHRFNDVEIVHLVK